MVENNSNPSSEEIDLGFLLDKIKSFFKAFLVGILQIIQFFWKHKFPLIGVGIAGIALGLYLASTAERIYVNELLIQPNYKSTQYVYDKVDNINFKIKNNDSVFLSEAFGSHYKKVKGLEIEPIVDVYNLIGESKEIQETFETLYVESGDASFFDEDINKINYSKHRIKLLIEGDEYNDSLTTAFFDFLKSNSFYEKQSELIYNKLKEQLEENKLMMRQIDSVIAFVQKNPSPQLTSNGLSFSGSQEVSGLLDRKRTLSIYDLELLERLSSEEDVIALVDKTTGIMDRSYNFSFKIVPFLFVGIYCFIFLFIYLRRKVITLL